MRLALLIILTVSAALAVLWVLDFSSVLAWAVEAQRGFQNQMAGAIRALKAGDAGAYMALLGATASYGFVHALGPGHGKYLVGGVGLGTSITAPRLLAVSLASSLCQSLWAIALVYGGFLLVEVSAQQLTAVAEDLLAPLSYLAITGVGLILVWRGARALRAGLQSHTHDHATCSHNHGPTPEEAAQVRTFREAAVLIASVAVRPCTGAIFLLVIAWQMDIKLAGAVAVMTMGLGTAALTSLVALSSIAARGLTRATSMPLGRMDLVMPAMQVFAGVILALFSLGLLNLTL